MRVLITGAAGNIGTAVRKELAAAGHELRLVDIRPIENPEGESLVLDIADGKAVVKTMEGIEAVAHLAYGNDLDGDKISHIQRNFDVNAKGTFFLLRAARKAAVKRFVYTSTLSVFGRTLELGERMTNEESPPTPSEAYGLTKYFGEEACRMFAARHGLSVICLRLCNVRNEERWQEAKGWKENEPRKRYWRSMATHVSDVARAIHLALTVPNISFEFIHIAADNKGRLTEIEKARKLLGFWPRHRLDL